MNLKNLIILLFLALSQTALLAQPEYYKKQSFTGGLTETSEPGDVNQDGEIDIILASSKLYWLENDGEENFTAHQIDNGNPTNAIMADVNGDGEMDIVATFGTANQVAWFENDGNENFTKHMIDGNLSFAFGLFAIDLDENGTMDILAGGSLATGVFWYDNDGSENFTKKTLNASFRGTYSIYAADMNNDGHIDVVASNASNDQVAWFENDGSENFTFHLLNSSFLNYAIDVFVDDVDGNGLLDIMICSLLNFDIHWYRNDGNGVFTRRTISSTYRSPHSVYTLDWDGDGDKDIITTSGTVLNAITIWVNDGNENFSQNDIISNFPGRDAYPVDIDKDGDIDIIGGASNRVDVFIACTGIDGDLDGFRDDCDCDDNDINNFPGNTEVIDGKDNDCDGLIDCEDPDLAGSIPVQLAAQNCGGCDQIRFDFCEGDATPDLELLLESNANYEAGATFNWYADDNNSQGNTINTPTVNTSTKNTRFYWVSQQQDCEGPARRVRVRVRKTSLVQLDLPAIGCGMSTIDLAAWVSDDRSIATGYTFYDNDPTLGSSPLGTVTATKGVVNSGQYTIVSLPASPVTYYAVASNNTGCQVTGSDEVNSSAGASLDPIANQTVNGGDLVQVNFSSPNATYILWFNLSSFNNPNIGIIGSLGMGNLLFTASNNSGSPLTATIRAVAYNGNCPGESRDFTITVNPGSSNRQAQNLIELTANKINAHDVQIDWQISYEFALTAIEIEKQKNDGEWATIGRQDATVGTHNNVSLQDGSHLDRGGMANETKYRLKLIHADGRAIWSQEVEVNFDYFNSKRFMLYPNPSDGRFRLRAAGLLEGEWRYKLSDGMGRTILLGKLQGSETAFDINHLPAGYYYLVMTSLEGKRYLEKLVKQ